MPLRGSIGSFKARGLRCRALGRVQDECRVLDRVLTWDLRF